MKKSIEYKIDFRVPRFQNFYRARIHGPCIHPAWTVANRAAQDIVVDITGLLRSALEDK